jgi:hypothetical protein
MANDQSRIREIAWMELFPWLGLVRAARLAFAPRMLILAAVGTAATAAGWKVTGAIFSGTENSDLRVLIAENDRIIPELLDPNPPEVSISVLDPARSKVSEVWNRLSKPFRTLFGPSVDRQMFLYLFICGLWAVLVWSIFGAAITRSAALWFAREDRLGLRRAFGWGVFKWPAYTGAAMFPFLGVAAITFFPGLVSVLLRLDVGVLLMAVVWPLVLFCGFVLAVLLVGFLFGWPLMWPTISAEGTDSFDALSRSYSYTYQRPVHYLFYAAVAGVLGALAWVVVIIFAKGVITYSYWAASWGSGVTRIEKIQRIFAQAERLPEQSWSLYWGAKAIGFWAEIVVTVAVGFLFSYFWCATTYIYFLLRQAVDATEMDEVAVEEEPENYSLPALQEEFGGAPRVDDPTTSSRPAPAENVPDPETPS